MKLTTTKDPKTGVISVTIGAHKINTGTTNRQDAKRIYQAAAQLAPHVAQFQLAGNPTVREAVEQWREHLDATSEPNTARNYAIHIQAWADHAAAWKRHVSSLTEKDFDGWVNARDGTKAATRKQRRSISASFAKFLVAKHYIMRDPTALVKVKLALLSHNQKERIDKRVFTYTEYTMLMDWLNAQIKALEAKSLHPKTAAARKLNTFKFWRAFTALSRWLGLRLGDVAQLEWDCFKKPGRIIVWTDKKDQRVSVELNDWPNAAHAVSLIPTDDKKYCFPVQRETIRNPRTRAKLSMHFARICEQAGLNHGTAHLLRHTFISDAVARGQPTPHIMSVTGHTSVKTHSGYVHYKNDE